ncbi:MAG: leucine--tRNA ligase [Firmicutes bacterium]|nr:leucine--tRNA ligase [Bacillota bacterium]
MFYNHEEIEKKWRQVWEETDAHATHDNTPKPRHYCLDMFPYPSGEGLHVGHWRGYVLSDVWCRYMKMKGYEILHPMGWDAFGLPAENAAIKKGLHPVVSTQQNIDNMKRQLKEMGSMYDWSREVNSSAPDYYKWTQWIFLKLHEMGLAYKKEAPINWCPSCRTGLADEEVVQGACERCGELVSKKYLNQWFFRITDYAERLLTDLEELDWPQRVITMQANWIGKSYGAEVIFRIDGFDEDLTIFTTRPDTLFGATYMVLAPEHPYVDMITTDEQKQQVREYVEKAQSATEVDRISEEKEKTGVFTGAYAINPVNGEKIPIWISDYVLLSYGTGAIMAVPAHDTRDFAFATKFNLPIRQVILPPDGSKEMKEAFADEGTMVNSGEFDGLSSSECFEKIVEKLSEQNLARQQVNYKLRDWLISRQRYWGAPIPMVYCEKCGTVPVPVENLPVLLPFVEKYQPSGTGESPLAAIPEFVHTKCPKCGGDAKRDTDTISQWVCSSWYFLRYASPHEDKVPFDEDKVKMWLPVDLYVGGVEHAILHLLYSRFITKVLYEAGCIDFKEPFSRLFNQGMICRVGEKSGKLEKMSKSKGNVVNPDTLVNKFGTDSLRAYELFIGPPELDSEWDDSGIEGVYRWLKKLFVFVKSANFANGSEISREVKRYIHTAIRKITEDIERFHMNTIISTLMECFNNLQDYAKKHPGRIYKESIGEYIRLMAPVVPHLAEELWQSLGNKGSIFDVKWPEFNPDFIRKDSAMIVVQVNGKVRDKIEMPAGSPQDKVQEVCLAAEKVKSVVDGKEIKKVIYVQDKILNIVVG